MDDLESLNHTKWNCKYHVVFIPKHRRKVLYGKIRQDLKREMRELAQRKECEIEEGSLKKDHVSMVIKIPLKHAVSQVIGYIKGKTAIYVARTYSGRERNFVGENFWGRGFFVSTVGADEKAIKEYVKKQEEDQKVDQLRLFATLGGSERHNN
jgi:putative transposase